MTVDELEVLITANTEQLQKEISKTQESIMGLSRNAGKSTGNLAASFIKASVFTKTLGLAVKAATGNLSGAISRLDTLNNYTNVMSNLGISSEDAEASIGRLSDKLTGLPTTLDDAVSSVQRFTSANSNVKASTDMFLALNNAILAGGANAQTQASALEQLSQAYAKGKPDMQEWRSAMVAMPAQLKQVAQAMGYVSADALGEALRGGTVSMNEFMATIVKLNTKGINGFQSFEEQAINSTGGVATSITNVKTAITRGLTEIMNAIGQSNIAGFFQFVAKVINSVIPYITGFVKACVWAVNSVISLFGGKVKSSVDTASSSLSGLGTSANSAAGKIDATNSSAKKLSKTLQGLAGFDEMNVLSDNSDSESSESSNIEDASTGPGALGNLDFSSWDTGLSNAGNKADEIAEKIKSAFSWFSDGMDFSGLAQSFSNYGDAIEYRVNGLKKILGGFMEHYLKPLSTWVINDALPHFFNSTAESIKKIDYDKITNALNMLWDSLEPFTETIGEGLLWLYDNVLIPLSLWTINDVLPAFLKILSGAIDIVNRAINDAMPVIDWLWKNCLSPIAEFTGGVIVAVLNGIGDALKWIASNEIVMTVLESLAIAIGLVSGALAIFNATTAITNAVVGIANAVVGVFSGIMAVLTSPITLVVAAIATLITVIILCVKHWDEIKETASQCWEKIQEVWNAVATWFNDTVLEPMKRFFSEAWDNLKTGATQCWDKIKEVWNIVSEWFNNTVIEPMKKFFSEAWDTLKNGANNAWSGITSIWSVVATWFNSNIVEPVKRFFTGAWNTIKNGASNAWSGVKSVWSTVANWFNSTIIEPIKKAFSGAWDTLKNGANNAWSGVKSIFSGVAGFFGDVFSAAWEKVKAIFSTGGQIFDGIKDGIVSSFKNIVNGIINGINSVVSVPFNAINNALNVIRGFNILGVAPFSGLIGTISVPQIPTLARGGIVDKPTYAMIGEAGKEAVVPLENNTGWIDELANKLSDKLGGNDTSVQLVVKIGEDTILDKVIKNMKSKSFETNGEVFAI